MNKRRILICDDVPEHHANLRAICEKLGFETIHHHHWISVVDYIKKNPPIHLLILDLGYPNSEHSNTVKYEGWKAIDELNKSNIQLPILIYSELYSTPDIDREAHAHLTEVSNAYKNGAIKAVASHAHHSKISEAIKSLLGSIRLNISGDISILHISDLQAGGDGILKGKENQDIWLPEKIFEAIDKFKESPQNEALKMRSPDLCFSTGDLTQKARPSEFAQYQAIVNIIGEHINNRNPGMRGLLGDDHPNIISIPGNHDLNWDIMRSRSVVLKSKKLVYDEDNPSKELDYINEYAWAPYSKHLDDALNTDKDWVWDPGSIIIDLASEIGLRIICINSARWSCSYTEHDHLQRRDSEVGVTLPEEKVREIKDALSRMKQDERIVNILLTHHTLDTDAKDENKLCISDGGHSKTITEIANKWKVSVSFSGHIHDTSVIPLTTKSNKKLTVVGAGTITSRDLGEFKTPQFNLVRFHGVDDASSMFTHITVISFHYDGANFIPHSCMLDGTQCWQTLRLK